MAPEIDTVSVVKVTANFLCSRCDKRIKKDISNLQRKEKIHRNVEYDGDSATMRGFYPEKIMEELVRNKHCKDCMHERKITVVPFEYEEYEEEEEEEEEKEVQQEPEPRPQPPESQPQPQPPEPEIASIPNQTYPGAMYYWGNADHWSCGNVPQVNNDQPPNSWYQQGQTDCFPM